MIFTLFLIVLIALGIWFGSIVFLSFIMAPSVFGALDDIHAARFLRLIFPRYFKLGLGCSIITLLGLVALWLTSDGAVGAWWFVALGAAVTMVVLTGSSLRLVPLINAARDSGAAGAARFQQLHRWSVALNAGTLVLALLALSATARVLMAPLA